MNIYNAIMKAADQIEQRPMEFDFMSCTRPKCGTPGCALGWIGVCADESIRTVDGDFAWTVAEKFLKLPDPWTFYARMRALCPERDGWKQSAVLCASTLRQYAKTHHGAEIPKKALMPDWNTMATRPPIADSVQSQDACHV